MLKTRKRRKNIKWKKIVTHETVDRKLGETVPQDQGYGRGLNLRPLVSSRSGPLGRVTTLFLCGHQLLRFGVLRYALPWKSFQAAPAIVLKSNFECGEEPLTRPSDLHAVVATGVAPLA